MGVAPGAPAKEDVDMLACNTAVVATQPSSREVLRNLGGSDNQLQVFGPTHKSLSSKCSNQRQPSCSFSSSSSLAWGSRLTRASLSTWASSSRPPTAWPGTSSCWTRRQSISRTSPMMVRPQMYSSGLMGSSFLISPDQILSHRSVLRGFCQEKTLSCCCLRRNLLCLTSGN